MKTLKELLEAYYKADKERDTARNDWVGADAEAIAAIAVRQEAARRWLAADVRRSKAAEDIGGRRYEV